MAESEMVERIARAILLHDYGCTPEEAPKLWLGALSTARAALEAMREPTLHMQNAGWAEIDKQDLDFEDVEVAPIFRAMISTALGQEATEG